MVIGRSSGRSLCGSAACDGARLGAIDDSTGCDSRVSAWCSCSAIVQEGATGDNIPAAARAALADLKDFLPYRSYRVLDTSWVLASSNTRQAVTSRFKGSMNRITKSSSIACRSDRQQCRSVSRCASPADIPTGNRSAALKEELRGVGGDSVRLEISSAGGALRIARRSDATPPAHRRRGMRDRARQKQLRYASGGATLDRHVLHHVARRDRRRRYLTHARRQQGADRPPHRRHARSQAAGITPCRIQGSGIRFQCWARHEPNGLRPQALKPTDGPSPEP